MSTPVPADFEIREIDGTDTHRLRHELLRPTQRLEEMAWPSDDVATHFGGFVSGRLVGIASTYPSEDRSWRLRAMAVCPDYRRHGIGLGLLDRCLDHTRAQGAADVWCNARTPALGFYQRAGFSTEGDEFDVPHAGPHFVMRRRFS